MGVMMLLLGRAMSGRMGFRASRGPSRAHVSTETSTPTSTAEGGTGSRLRNGGSAVLMAVVAVAGVVAAAL